MIRSRLGRNRKQQRRRQAQDHQEASAGTGERETGGIQGNGSQAPPPGPSPQSGWEEPDRSIGWQIAGGVMAGWAGTTLVAGITVSEPLVLKACLLTSAFWLGVITCICFLADRTINRRRRARRRRLEMGFGDEYGWG